MGNLFRTIVILGNPNKSCVTSTPVRPRRERGWRCPLCGGHPSGRSQSGVLTRRTFHHHRNPLVDQQVGWKRLHTHTQNKTTSHTFISLVHCFLDSPTKSPCKSRLEPSVVSSSFYGKQKPIYLTPLERKAIKESLPSPLPSPPSQEEKKNKKNVKGSRKPGKVAAGRRNAEKMGFRHTASARTLKPSQVNSRFVSQ